jgi:hypothetical protein
MLFSACHCICYILQSAMNVWVILVFLLLVCLMWYISTSDAQPIFKADYSDDENIKDKDTRDVYTLAFIRPYHKDLVPTFVQRHLSNVQLSETSDISLIFIQTERGNKTSACYTFPDLQGAQRWLNQTLEYYQHKYYSDRPCKYLAPDSEAYSDMKHEANQYRQTLVYSLNPYTVAGNRIYIIVPPDTDTCVNPQL